MPSSNTTHGVLFDTSRARRLDSARATFPAELVERFERGLFETDTVVDRVVEDFAALPSGLGWQLLERALASQQATVPGAPASLEALLAPLMDPPAWFDADRVAWGAAVWWRFFVANVIGLGGALLLGYQHGDLVKPQALNGRSEKLAARRYEETARWVLAATDPGGVVPGRAGFDETIRIRIVHAVIRRRLRNDPVWDRAAWGDPIHATGMSLTNLAFLLLPIATFDLLGMPLAEDETEAVRQLWYWIGHVMGVPDDLLPATIEWARQFAAAAPAILAPPDQDCAELTRAVMRAGVRPERALPRPLRAMAAPVLRPLISRAVWGASNTILTEHIQPGADSARRDHPVIAILRPVVARREARRRAGRLGTDLEIARQQRAGLGAALALVKAAERPLQPHEAGEATR
ncbi:MAG: oxygenase MpaB family protein [Acidimicrobiales bacterium]